MGNNQRVRAGSHSHMSHDTQAISPRFQQRSQFFNHMAKLMHDSNGINFEKMSKMGGVEFEGTADPTDAE